MDKTLAKGLGVLEFLVNSDGPCSVSDVARGCMLLPSNAHRTLKTLTSLGYVVQRDDARYQPSMRLFELGSKVAGALDIRQVARPAMARLASETLETIHLVVREGHQIIYVDKIDSPQPVAAYSRIGGTAPAQCVASGKVLLAFAMPADAAAALAWLEHSIPVLEPYTPSSHRRYDALLQDLQQARARRYAVNRGEWRADVSGLGAPILDVQGRAVGALGISLPSMRADAGGLDRLIGPLRDAAASTSAMLGYRPDAPFRSSAGDPVLASTP